MPNFFEAYDDYTKDTEPPPNFHAWSAIGALSAVLGKKCFIPQGHFTVFPNLYIVLVGSPGTRKTSAMNIAKRLVRLLEKVPMAPESSTREALIDDMAKNKVIATLNGREISYWQASAFVSELQEFLGGKHINQSMVGFLTAIWDEPIFKERTRKGGEVIIHNPYFSMLGCCTPEWMNGKLKQDVITDGFSRRTIFALEEELNTLNPRPVTTPEQLKNLAILSNEIQRIWSIGGEFKLSVEAGQYYDEKYRNTREEAKKFSNKVQSYFTSKHILALKLAMCLSAGVDSNRVISSHCIRLAFEFLEQSERSLDTVFAGVGRNELKALSEKLYHSIRASGKAGMATGQITGTSFDDMRLDEINECVDVLVRTGRIVPTGLVQDVPRYRAVEIEKSTPAVHLLRQARLLKPCQERPEAEIGVFELARLLDPATAQLLSRQAQSKSQTDNGVLLKGKRPPMTGEPEAPSELPEL